jgi:hypothetical protein
MRLSRDPSCPKSKERKHVDQIGEGLRFTSFGFGERTLLVLSVQKELESAVESGRQA